MRLLAILFVLPISATMAASPDTPETTNHYYTYFDQKLPLRVDGARIATFQASGAAVAALPSLDAYGIAAADIEPHERIGWNTARTPGADMSAEAVELLVAAIADDPAVDFASPYLIGPDELPMLVTRDLLVGFAAHVPAGRAEELLDSIVGGILLDRDFAGTPGLYRVRALSKNGFEVLDLANQLAALPETLYAEPDFLMTARKELIPNDTFFSSLWGLHNTGQTGGTNNMDMDAPQAWDITTGNPGVLVVVMDTGVDQTHPDLNQVPGMDFTGQGTGGGPGNACDNHGTAVAGCVSAIINNGVGVVGIAPSCRVASAYVFVSSVPCSAFGSVTVSSVVNALDWAEQIGARVTNASITMPQVSTITNKYNNTYFAGIVHFSASGNSGTSGIGYPANLTLVQAVGAVNHFGNRAGFSTYGNGLAFVAPGETIVTTDRQGAAGYSSGNFTTEFGTSFASPYAAGVAALMLSLDPTLTSDEVVNIMNLTCKDRGAAGYDQFYGHGIVNAASALNYILNPPPAPGSFDLLFPADDAMAIPVNTLYSWTNAPNVVNYTLQVDDDPNFVNPDISVTTVFNFSTPGITLEQNRVYYWRVIANNANGSTPSNPAVASFTTLSDCNGNGIDDAMDISNSTSLDCNGNGVPDECDLDGTYRFRSLDLSPINGMAPQSMLIDPAPVALTDVSLTFRTMGDINFSSEFYAIDLNGAPVGSVFVSGFSDCLPNQTANLIVPAAAWNGAIVGEQLTLNIVPSAGVDESCNSASWVNVTVMYEGEPRSADSNSNQVPDECESECVCADSNCDGIVTPGDIAYFVTALSQGQAAWDALPGTDCDFLCANDTNGDQIVSPGDIASFVAALTSGACQ